MCRPSAFVLLLILTQPSDAMAESPPEVHELVRTSTSYESKGRTIRVDRIEPKAPGTYPGVLILHGSGGLALRGLTLHETARHLASRGFVADVVHYFDATGTLIADKPTIVDRFPTWLQALADGLTNLSRHPKVDPDRLGLVGYSLGAYLSLSLSVFDPRVAAVVDYFGGLPEPLARELKGFPPTLILHGEADRIVPVAEARTLESLLKERGVAYEMALYPGQGHGFLGPPAQDATNRVDAFLGRHLKGGGPVVRHQAARPPLDRLDALKARASSEADAKP